MSIEANISDQHDIENADALSNALAILTLVTGEPWSKQKLLDTNLALRTEAAKALSFQGMTRSDADSVVEERWAEYEAHELPTPPPPQAGFRTTLVSDTPVVEDTSWADPLVAPTHDDLVERVKQKLAARRAAKEEAETSEEVPASGEQI